MKQPTLLTEKQAADALNLSVRTLRKQRQSQIRTAAQKSPDRQDRQRRVPTHERGPVPRQPPGDRKNGAGIMIPRLTLCRWGGTDTDGLHDYSGRSLVIEWLGLILEINFGKAKS